MIAGAIRNQIDKIWHAFWSDGISNPLEVIEQITYLLFLRTLGGDIYEYLRARHPKLLHDAKLREHFHHRMFHGFDFDNTMLRIGSMNMLLHGVENPDIRYRDSLAQDHAGEEEKYTLVLANPPFAGSLDDENTAKDLLQIIKTKKTELLFLALFLRLLKPGGRAAMIVPDGVLFGSSKAHKELRRLLVEEQKLDDKRTPLLPEDKLGPDPRAALSDDEHAKNNLPDVIARWAQRDGAERERARTARSFCVPKAGIAAQGYDLSLNRYKEVVHEAIEHRAPKDILAALAKLEEDIQRGMKEWVGMLK